MVQLEEISDESWKNNSSRVRFAEDDDGFEDESDVNSELSSDEEDEITEKGLVVPQETIFERISALRDIISPSTRRSISRKFQTTSEYTWFGGRLLGNLVWVVTTTGLLVGLPLVIAIEEESKVVQQEREIAQQTSGAQQMLGGMPQSGDGKQGEGLKPPGF